MDSESEKGNSEAPSNFWTLPPELTPQPKYDSPGFSREFVYGVNKASSLPLKQSNDEYHEELKQRKEIQNLKYSYFLKQYSEVLDLYDEVDKEFYDTYYNLQKKFDSSSIDRDRRAKTAICTGLSVLTVLKLKKLPVLNFNSYIENFYPILSVGLFSSIIFNHFQHVKESPSRVFLRTCSQIFDVRNFIHAKATVLSNLLKYPEGNTI